MRVLLDRLARYAISLGGIAVIVSVLGILLFLVKEVLPLFRAASVQESARISLTTAPTPSVAVGLDEHHELAYLVDTSGIRFFDLPSGGVRNVTLPSALDGVTITAMARADASSPRLLLGTIEGTVLPARIVIHTEFTDEGTRVKHPAVSVGLPRKIGTAPIALLAYRTAETGSGAAVLTRQGEVLYVGLGPSDEEEGSGRTPPMPIALTIPPGAGAVTALALDNQLLNLFVGTEHGWVHHVSLSGPTGSPILNESYRMSPHAITRLGFLLGDRSLVVMTAAGTVSTWIQTRDQARSARWLMVQNHTFAPLGAAVSAFAASPRNKGFIIGDTSGQTAILYATSERTVARMPAGGSSILAVAMAPKADGVISLAGDGLLRVHRLRNPHPEITWGTLFGKVWYEGYAQPAHVWQSSSGSDDFEPKLGLVSLIFGTIKGTLYALLLAVPLAILAALFTSQFMHPDLRASIKPTIEVMAAMPTVVLGFLAGLWLAPRLERFLPALVGMTIMMPLLIGMAWLGWRLLPRTLRHRVPHGTEALLLMPVLAMGITLCVWGNRAVEQVLFAGDATGWLEQTFGLTYDQRNALVVGIMMGFAVIPVIYSISEEALANVPRHLIAGSLALGATQWQTVLNLVLLTASPGIFSAVMIGFGRAVGETMIVLMATGNTPVMDWSAFNGFRTLSANIAVEIPEAPHGGTLYRTLFLTALLLFVVTFVINTVAEAIRHRLRRRYSH